MTNSPEQDDILNFVETTTSNLIIEACPGSGKTTTLALIARTLPQDGSRHVALAFARANAEDFKTKLPYWVESSTCHSLCKSAIEASWAKRPKIVADKLKWILKDVAWELRSDVQKLVSLMKQQPHFALADANVDHDEVAMLAESFGIESSSECVTHAVRALLLSDEDRSRIDFDDMLRFAGLDASIRFPRFATVMVDEAQDTNGIQRVVLEKLATRPQGAIVQALVQMGGTDITPLPRFVLVGDPNQAIYAFRGADANAMTTLSEAFACETRTLSVSWRCSRAVCEEANLVLRNTI